MGKKSRKPNRVANSNRGRGSHFKNFRPKSSTKPSSVDAGKRRSSQNETRTERPEQVARITLKEHQVGITEFVSDGKGFTGVVKSRFSDFHVNEIDLDGTILHLNDLTVPIPIDPDYNISSEEFETARNDISDIVTEDVWKEIQELAKGVRTNPIDIDVKDLDKEKRTTIHKVIKKIYEHVCTTVTLSENDNKIIRVLKQVKGENRRNKWVYPGEYVHFLIYKENMDTSEVAVILANGLRVKPSQINYCGTKDKRGKTTQKFCVKRRHPTQIARALKSIPSLKIGDFTFHENVIKLGDLKGNRFRIALRLVDGDQTEIEKSLQSAKEYGFINYYGLQRFGNNASIPTFQIGIALLKSDYKTACELILKPRDNDIPFMRTIRTQWWTKRDSTAAAAMFHNDRFIEKKLLDGLSQYGESDYANALRKIPRNMLLLYTHAYQSLIFNRVASKRIKEHGLKLIVGDLVYRNQDELDEIALDTENELDNVEHDTDAKNEATKPKDDESSFKQKVKSLTEDDISSGKYTIFDIVLPLPGHDITYPANEAAQWYENILIEESLSSEKLKHGVKTFSLAGAYRKLLVQPQNMSWYFKKYNTPEEDVILSHFEKPEEIVDTDGEGKFTALVLDFCLPASVYATMFLREILKSDTSSTNQAQIGRDQMKKFEDKDQAELKEKDERNTKSLNVETEAVNDDSILENEITNKRSDKDADEPDVKRVKQD